MKLSLNFDVSLISRVAHETRKQLRESQHCKKKDTDLNNRQKQEKNKSSEKSNESNKEKNESNKAKNRSSEKDSLPSDKKNKSI